MDIGGAEAQFSGACADLNALRGVDFLKLCGYFLGAVGGTIVNDDEFPFKVTVRVLLGSRAT